jgi:hypothetical protein
MSWWLSSDALSPRFGAQLIEGPNEEPFTYGNRPAVINAGLQ